MENPASAADQQLLAAASQGDMAQVLDVIPLARPTAAHGPDDRTALHAAAEAGHLEVVETLLLYGWCVKARTAGGSTALHLAAKEGHLDVVRVLLAGGASHSEHDSAYATPLHLAAAGGHAPMVRALIDAGADIDAYQGLWGDKPLLIACKAGHVEVVQELLDAYHHSMPDAAAGFGSSNVFFGIHFDVCRCMYEACCAGNREMVSLLLARGAAVHVVRHGWVLLLVAVSGQNPLILRLLLEAGAEPDASGPQGSWLHMRFCQTAANRNWSGMTALQAAVELGHASCVEVLVAAGADANKLYGAAANMAADSSLEGATMLHRAVQLGDAAAVPLLATPHNMRHVWAGRTPLHMALVAGEAEMAQAMVTAGSPTGVSDMDGTTALCLAARSCSAALRLLLPAMMRREWNDYQQQKQGARPRDPGAVPPTVLEAMCTLLLTNRSFELDADPHSHATSGGLGTTCFEAILEVAGVTAASSLLRQVVYRCRESGDAAAGSGVALDLVMTIHRGWLAALDPLLQVRWKWANRLQRLVNPQQQKGWCSRAASCPPRLDEEQALTMGATAAAHAQRWPLFVQLMERLTGLEELGPATFVMMATAGEVDRAQPAHAVDLCQALLEAWWDHKQHAARRADQEAADAVVTAVQAWQGRQLRPPRPLLLKQVLRACGVVQQQAAAGAAAMEAAVCAAEASALAGLQRVVAEAAQGIVWMMPGPSHVRLHALAKWLLLAAWCAVWLVLVSLL